MHKASFVLLAMPVRLLVALGAALFLKHDGAVAGPTDNALGVTRSEGAAGELVTVDVLGTALVQAGEDLSNGDPVTSNAQGQAVKATGAAMVRGTALSDTAAGELVDVLLIPCAKAPAV